MLLFTVLSLFLNWKFTFYSRYVLCDRCGKGLCSPRVQRYAVCILSMFQTYNFSSFYCFIPFHVPMIQHLILLMFPYFNVATFQHFLISVFHNPTISFFQWLVLMFHPFKVSSRFPHGFLKVSSMVYPFRVLSFLCFLISVTNPFKA